VRLRLVLATAAVAAVTGTGAALAIGDDAPTDYVAPGGTFSGVRPTAVGLPQIGVKGNVGASELATAVKNYHDSGQYGSDLAKTGAAAEAYLTHRLDQNAAKGTRTCKARYVKTRKKLRGKRLYRKAKRCRTVTPPRLTGKPAIVLDIDETSLSNYRGAAAAGFTAAGSALDSVAGTGTAIEPTLKLFNLAKSRGVAVFFVTGRPEALRSITEGNLRKVGYDGWQELVLKPGGIGTLDYKAGARKRIEGEGYDIVVNVGDQESDLDGGFADKAFKLPNPFYFISD
jgi:hypothetical protein